MVDAAARLRLGRNDLNALYWEIAGSLAPDPERPLLTIEELASALADTLPDPAMPHPVLELFERLAELSAAEPVGILRGHADAIALRFGQAEKLAARRLVGLSAQKTRAGSAIVIRLERSAPRPDKRFMLTAWRYDMAHGDARQIYCEDEACSLSEIRARVKKVITAAIPDLPPEGLRVEFALPDGLLNLPIENWDLGDRARPLGVSYAVVVRFAHRDPPAEHAWRSRGERIRSSQGRRLRGAMRWIDCHDPRDLRQFNGLLEANSDWPLVALTAWLRGAPVPLALRAALGAGIPAVLWRHDRCPGHDYPPGSAAHASCRGDRFRGQVTTLVADLDFDGLPEFVRRLRADAAAQYPPDPEHPGRDIAILWDDPRHVPWALAPSLHEPA
jgi:hypothetical protein